MSSRPTTSHWGAYRVRTEPDGEIVVTPHPDDPAPSPLLGNIPGALRHATRVRRPAVRRGWLDARSRPERPARARPVLRSQLGTALDLVAAELARVRGTHGNQAIFGGSYGWASAGRFHHAQSQLHRFLNCSAAATCATRNTYSLGTSEVLLPHVVGDVSLVLRRRHVLAVIAEHTELVVAFGGLPQKNAAVSPGGVPGTARPGWLSAARGRGCRFVLGQPAARRHCPASLDAEWIAPAVPATDAALMLGARPGPGRRGPGRPEFLDTLHASGYPRSRATCAARPTACPRTPQWAGVTVRRRRPRASGNWRGGWRPRAPWSRSAGRCSAPGTGSSRSGLRWCWPRCSARSGCPAAASATATAPWAHRRATAALVRLPRLPQGRNAVSTFIPVARIADMLLQSRCRAMTTTASGCTYPDIRLVYWAGGNPFHHHQDLARLRAAFGRPETVVVHEPFWTATARHADIVLPVTTTWSVTTSAPAQHDRLFAMPGR